MPLLLLVLAGIVLRANPTWFNGAHTVGTVCLDVGIVGFVLFVAIFLLGLFAVSGRR